MCGRIWNPPLRCWMHFVTKTVRFVDSWGCSHTPSQALSCQLPQSGSHSLSEPLLVVCTAKTDVAKGFELVVQGAVVGIFGKYKGDSFVPEFANGAF